MFNASLPSGLASHGSELSFIFGGPGVQSTAANQALSAKIQSAWASFAKHPTAGPGWREYSPATSSLADLSGEGTRDAITIIDRSIVDSRCSVF